MVRRTGGCVTPCSEREFGLSVMVKGGGRILRVTVITEPVTPLVTLTFQRSIWSVVIGGIVRVVVTVVRS